MAEALAAELRPASRAYHEIWLDGEKQVSTESEEPFYRDRYLPRKFKVAVGLSTDNCVDIWSQDVGLLAIVQDGRIQGFNLLVGGGLGMTHNKGDTTARLAQPLGFVPTEHGVEAVRLVAAIFRDHGNRSDRRHARLKYLIAEWGIQRFREEFQRRASFTLGPPVALPPLPFHDHLGRHRQSDGRWFYGVFIQSGRIVDTGRHELKTALHEIVTRLRPGIRLTGQQNLLLTDLDADGIETVERILRAHGVTLPTRLSAARRFSMACPALPTCGLAVAESERAIPAILDQFEAELDEPRPPGRAAHHPDDGLPQRLRAAVHRRSRVRRALARPVQRVRGRRAGRRPAGGSLPRRRAGRGAARHACARCCSAGPPSAPGTRGWATSTSGSWVFAPCAPS